MLNSKICVVGLGYVGLPLIHHFCLAGAPQLVGVDTSPTVLESLYLGQDHTSTVPEAVITENAGKIRWTSEVPADYDIYIICVPTPDDAGKPVYTYVDSAIEAVLAVAGDGASIVVESTVAPETVQKRIVPRVQKDIAICYSPERINPGPNGFVDMTLCYKLLACDSNMPKNVSDAYQEVFKGVVILGDTRVAELAKCFENTQRDMNIALMNELAMNCHRHGVDYKAVKAALATKSTSPRFESGLVGGHCIPVDPFYLAEWYNKNRKEGEFGCLPIESRLAHEDYMSYVISLAEESPVLQTRRILIIGAAYKPNVVDTRNSGGLDLLGWLSPNYDTQCYDPICDMLPDMDAGPFNIVIGVTNHDAFKDLVISTKFRLAIDCKFINVGNFRSEQLVGIHQIIEL